MLKFEIKVPKTKPKSALRPCLVALLLCCFSAARALPPGQAPQDTLDLRNRASALSSSEEYAEAALLLASLQDHYHQDGDWEASIQVALERATLLQRSATAENKREAARLLETAYREDAGKLPETGELRWTACHKTGVAYHLAGDYPLAVAYYKEALEGRQRFLKPTAAEMLQGNLNIANSYYRMGHFRPAIEYGNNALAFRQGIPPKKVNELYTILARAYRETGDLQQAAVYNGVLLAYHRQLDEEDQWMLANFLVDLAIYHNKIGQPDSSLEFASRSKEILMGFESLIREDSISLANAYYNMGDACTTLGLYDRAVDNYRQALALNKALFGERSLELAHVYNNLGLAYYHMKDWEMARSILDQALAIKQSKAQWKEEQSSTWENLGDVYYARGDLEKALEAYHTSLRCHLPSFDNENRESNPAPGETELASTEVTILLLAAKANVQMAMYLRDGDLKDLQHSWSTYVLASGLIDDLRLSFQADESKTFLVEKTRPVYEAAIEASLLLHERLGDEKYLDEAFTFVERSKAIILLDAVRKGNAKTFSTVSGGLADREREVKAELGWLERQAREARYDGDESEVARITGLLLAEQLRYDSLLEVIRMEEPDYYALMHNVATTSPAVIRSDLLLPDQAMLNYFVGSDNIFIFFLSSGQYKVFKLRRDSTLNDRIRELRSGIYDPFTQSGQLSREEKAAYDAMYSEQAYSLYQELLEPVEAAGLPTELIIVPDDVLGYLPFEALLTEAGSRPGAYASMPYVLRRHRISYAYSATLLWEMSRKPSGRGTPTWLGFAPEFAAGNPSGLGPLLFNHGEVERLQRLTSGRALFDKEASKANFVSMAPSFNVLHLSSHGRAHDLAPNDSSFIAFSGQEKERQLMFAWELYDLPLRADMVVLSVCETGLGRLQRGEGIISLARAFAYAGAKSVVTTLWKVNDQASSDLMVAYYAGLEKGLAKDEALARAKMAMLDKPASAAPYYWAGFIATGDMSPLYRESHFGLTLLLLAFATALAWYFWKKRKILIYRD